MHLTGAKISTAFYPVLQDYPLSELVINHKINVIFTIYINLYNHYF